MSLVLGAVPLLVQIIDGTSRIRKTIMRFNSASDKIQKLDEKLALLQNQCSIIRHTLTKLSLPSQDDDQDSPLGNIFRWLSRVSSKIDSIESILSHIVVDSSQSRFHCQKSAFRFLMKQDRIEEFVRDLDDDMRNLGGIVLVQFWFVFELFELVRMSMKLTSR